MGAHWIEDIGCSKHKFGVLKFCVSQTRDFQIYGYKKPKIGENSSPRLDLTAFARSVYGKRFGGNVKKCYLF